MRSNPGYGLMYETLIQNRRSRKSLPMRERRSLTKLGADIALARRNAYAYPAMKKYFRLRD